MTLAAVTEVTHAPLSTLRVGFAMIAIIAAVLIYAAAVQLIRSDDHAEILAAHTDHLSAHDEHIDWLTQQVEAVLGELKIVVYPPVADDSPGHEAELFEPATEPIPAQKPTPRPRPEPPPTEPSKAIIVGGARLPAPDDAKTFAAEWVENELVKIRARMAEVGPREHRDEPMEESA